MSGMMWSAPMTLFGVCAHDAPCATVRVHLARARCDQGMSRCLCAARRQRLAQFVAC